jgi:hypothetical protein
LDGKWTLKLWFKALVLQRTCCYRQRDTSSHLLSAKSCNNWSRSGWFTKFQLSLVLVIRTWPTIALSVQMYPQVEFFSCWWLQREYNPPLGRDTWLMHSSQIKNLILHWGEKGSVPAGVWCNF